MSCNSVLEELALRTASILHQIADDELRLNQSLSPQACIQLMAVTYQRKTGTIQVTTKQQGGGLP